MGETDTEIWPCTSTVKYQAICYDADSVLGEGGEGVGSGIFVLVRCMCGLLRSATSSQAGRSVQVAAGRSQVGRILFTARSRLMGMQFQ